MEVVQGTSDTEEYITMGYVLRPSQYVNVFEPPLSEEDASEVIRRFCPSHVIRRNQEGVHQIFWDTDRFAVGNLNLDVLNPSKGAGDFVELTQEIAERTGRTLLSEIIYAHNRQTLGL